MKYENSTTQSQHSDSASVYLLLRVPALRRRGGGVKHIGILKPDILVDILNRVGVPVVALYAFSMFVYPLIDSRVDWQQIQNVWDRWQALNVGMLAFISSIVAFNISKYNAEKQRERDFHASNAFLPDALSGLCSYLRSSVAVFIEGWNEERGNPFRLSTPQSPSSYKEVFRECIRHAEPDVGANLSKILRLLQVHAARLEGYIEQQRNETWTRLDKHNLIPYLYRLGELQALIDKLFPFSRDMAPFDSSPLVWEDFRNAYGILGIWVDEIRIDETNNLEAYTRRALERAVRGDAQPDAAADA